MFLIAITFSQCSRGYEGVDSKIFSLLELAEFPIRVTGGYISALAILYRLTIGVSLTPLVHIGYSRI